ncbi:MAG: HAD-IA family hydrolase [Kiritimatiellia bacterium]|nr:HAD-IA family hydrolase [Kiritimatiellia bacterium]
MCPTTENDILGIIFDMDGVLCDSEPFICKAGQKMLAERHGLNVKPEDFAPFVGTGEDSFLSGPARKYGVQINLPSDKDRTYEIYLEIIKGKLKPLAGVKEFISAGRLKKVKMAVATSADKVKMNGNLLEIGISPESFNALVCGNEVVHKKPHPEIFLLAARKLGLPAGNCLVIEDAPSGLQAAKSAGMRALGLTTSFNAEILKKSGADWIAPDLTHLPSSII